MDPFLGEIRLMPYGGPSGSYIPNGWAQCNGQLLSIRQNTALFSLLGTQYGGDGVNTFALPDLRGRAAVGAGQGQGLTQYTQGTATGMENVPLQAPQLPAHDHTLTSTPLVPASTDAGSAASPVGGYFAPLNGQYGDGGGSKMAATLLNGSSTPAGGSTTHANSMPYLVLSYYIATLGIFPQRQ